MNGGRERLAARRNEERYSSGGVAASAKRDGGVTLIGNMGKVHGSLSRAGKVRNQTPKVAKQERKKKRLQGRAKKRNIYNRRFINVLPTVGGGKRKGLNSQAPKEAISQAKPR